eukprot:TRINITY_DN2651_c0_g2_i1.p1 TRINITY_DN2651_c0_g2~~TRINITY_DN2651_c0_g2_i1.p1  ORF type:complete len:470 (+),score=97.67 TRINITY_DN2651_c0_g2_i1:29-1438(+)
MHYHGIVPAGGSNGFQAPLAPSNSPGMPFDSCASMAPGPLQSQQFYLTEPQGVASSMNHHYMLQQIGPTVPQGAASSMNQGNLVQQIGPTLLMQQSRRQGIDSLSMQRDAWNPQLVQQAVASNGCSSEGDCRQDTTLMIRNLPGSLTQEMLLNELDQSGFVDRYDFAYMPRCHNTGNNKGYAFVNMVNSSIASAFRGSWHRSRRFGLKDGDAFLNVSAAKIQGLQANMDRWCGGKKINTPQPFVRKMEATSDQQHSNVARAVMQLANSQSPHFVAQHMLQRRECLAMELQSAGFATCDRGKQPPLRGPLQINLAAAIDSHTMSGHQDSESAASSLVEDCSPSKQVADVTTLMIRNLPNDVAQQSLIEELVRGGFGEAYDFVYMPPASTSLNKGYAFVNMKSTTLAGIFIGAWHLSHRFGTVISVSAAELQGFQANQNRWGASRKSHMQNPCSQPIIRMPPEPAKQVKLR